MVDRYFIKFYFAMSSKILFMLLSCCVVTNVKTQVLNRSFLDVEIKEVDRPEEMKTGRLEFICNVKQCTASLKWAIISALDVDSVRLKIKGNCPNKFISFTKRDCKDSIYGIQDIRMKVLAHNYHFTVSDITEFTEVWVLKKKGNVELPLFFPEAHEGVASSGYQEGYFELIGRPLYDLSNYIQYIRKNIVIDETNDSNLYDYIKIPYASIEDKEELNKELLNYGFEIVIEKRLEKFKLVQFND
jgi:hypothetical protein